MTVSTRISTERTVLGWQRGQPTSGIYFTFVAWVLSLLPMFAYKSVGFVALSAVFAVGVAVAVGKSRGFVEFQGDEMVVAPMGSFGTTSRFRLSSLTAVTAVPESYLVVLEATGRQHRFGPWLTLGGRATGMLAPCERVAQRVAQRVES